MNESNSDSALDWDAEDQQAQDSEDEKLTDRVVHSYANLPPSKLGDGFFYRSLASFHEPIDLASVRTFFSSPRSLSHMDNHTRTPDDHPWRAIARVLHEAPENTTVRVSWSRLTDIVAMELLIRAGNNRDVQLILSPHEDNLKGLKKFIATTGLLGKNALLENLEVRLANWTGTTCESRDVAMHRKSIITDTFAVFGSYNLSSFARVGNWEEVTIVESTPQLIQEFDSVWTTLETRQMEKFYRILTELPWALVAGPERRLARPEFNKSNDAKRVEGP
jgi:PLD-like domain